MIARVRELVDRSLPTFAIPGQRVAFLKLLRRRGVYDTRDGGLSLASFRSVSKISLPATTAGCLRVDAVVTGETLQHLENGIERTLRSRQETSEMKERLGITPHMDKTLASDRRRYLQLARDLLTRDLVTLIEVDEVREHAGVFLVDKTRDRYTAADHSRGQQHAFKNLHRGVSLVTSEGLSRAEVALENDDEDPGELSKLAGLHLGLADVKDAFRRFENLDTVQLLLGPP